MPTRIVIMTIVIVIVTIVIDIITIMLVMKPVMVQLLSNEHLFTEIFWSGHIN